MSKILIVDDDESLSNMLKEFLESEGHQVEWAPDPVQGMLRARQWGPDMMILDYQMPRDTGAHLFETLRRNQATATLPVLFMSGSMPPARIMEQITSSQYARFLSKPVQLETLKQTVEEILKGSKP